MVLGIDFVTEFGGFDPMHHTGPQGADSTNKIFCSEIPAAPGIQFPAVFDQAMKSVCFQGDVKEISFFCFCPLIEPGIAGKEILPQLPSFCVSPFVKEHTTVIK